MIYGRFIGSLSFVLVLVLTYGPMGAFYTISSIFVCFLMNTCLYENDTIEITVSGHQSRRSNRRTSSYYEDRFS